ncbi:MAG: hypothetical protein KUG77_19280 [Nannocystaceae bacterium]|nr:hypothetical protein [Nannocystaceae bacterium]
MPVPPLAFAGAGFAAVLTSWVTYLATTPSGKVPVRPYGHFAAQALGVGLAATGIATGVTTGGALLPVLVGAPAVTFAAMFGYLYTQRATPAGRLQVAVGDPLRPFTALTPEGDTFDVASLLGRRVLLKFFRGHW